MSRAAASRIRRLVSSLLSAWDRLGRAPALATPRLFAATVAMVRLGCGLFTSDLDMNDSVLDVYGIDLQRNFTGHTGCSPGRDIKSSKMPTAFHSHVSQGALFTQGHRTMGTAVVCRVYLTANVINRYRVPVRQMRLTYLSSFNFTYRKKRHQCHR